MNFENQMGALQPIEQNNQRVLTTAQLAEAYGTDSKTINRNFQRNTERYKQGKHFFALSGEELKAFKGLRQFDDSLKFTSILYLWTEKGAWLHAKSLNTDNAWDAYETLVDEYYKAVEQAEMTTEHLTSMLAMRLGSEVAEIRKDIHDLKQNQPLHPAQAAHVTKEVNRRIYGVIDEYFGGNKKAAKKLFGAINKDIHQAFRTPNRSMIPNGKYEETVRFIKEWQPDSVTRHQLRFELSDENKKEA